MYHSGVRRILYSCSTRVAIRSISDESASGPPLARLRQVVFVVCWAPPTTRRFALRVESLRAPTRENSQKSCSPRAARGKMAEVYSTPTNSSSEPTEEASLDVLAQEEMDGMVSRLKSLVEAGAIPSKVGASSREITYRR